VILADKAVQLIGQRLFIQRVIANVEIQSALFFADLSASHATRNQGTEKVHGRVHAHQTIAAIPVDSSRYRRAGFRERLSFLRHMNDVAFNLDRGADPDRTTLPSQRTGIARLSAAGVVKDCPIKNDAAAVVYLDHSRITVLQIGIVTEQLFRSLGHRSLQNIYAWRTQTA